MSTADKKKPVIEGSVKVYFNDAIVRVSAQHLGVKWETFCRKVRELLQSPLEGLEDESVYRVVYTDEEGDTLPVKTSAELAEAMVCQPKVKRFRILTIPEAERKTKTRVQPVSRTEEDVIVEQVEESSDASSPAPTVLSVVDSKVANEHLVRLIKAMKFDQAATYFATAKQQYCSDPRFLYNGACATALSGKVDEACEALMNAIAAGYRDVTHMITDTDLSVVRGHPLYEKAVSMLSSIGLSDNRNRNPSPSAPSASPSPSPPPSSPTPSPAVEKPYPYQLVLHVLSDMGIEDSPELRTIVTRCKGDVQKVVDQLL